METTTKSNLPLEKKSRTSKFIKNNKFATFLLILLVIGTGWAIIKIYTVERRMNKEKQQITGQFIDETTKVFSWAIRGELLRDNREQVNQFFSNLVKEPGFKKIQLVDVSNSKVIISTDKKDEGTVVTDTMILNANDIRQSIDGDIIRSIAPVMGMNSKVAILVIDRSVPSNE